MKKENGKEDNRRMWMIMGIGIVWVLGFFIKILVLRRYIERKIEMFME